MKIRWLGQSAFLITSEEGTTIITDPYKTGMFIGLRYRPIEEAADIVTVSHRDPDHNNVAAVRGNPQVVRSVGSFEAKGIEFRGIASYHGLSVFRLKRSNTIFCFTVDNVRVCHLGDLGHQLSDEQVADIREVDVLMIPIGGFFTIDGAGASKVCDRLKPRVAIPMHYKTDSCLFPLARLDPFLEGKTDVKRMATSEAEFKKEELPSPTEIVVLEHAR